MEKKMKKQSESSWNLGAFLKEKVYPAVFERLDVAFPEFGWVRRGNKWEATERG